MDPGRQSLIVKLKISIPHDYFTTRPSLPNPLPVSHGQRQPTPENDDEDNRRLPRHPMIPQLKEDLRARHREWLEACATGNAELADKAEDELDAVEQRAKDLDRIGFIEWKFGSDGYASP